MAISIESTNDYSGLTANLRVIKLDGVDLAEVAAATTAEQDITVTGLLTTDIPLALVLSAAVAGIGVVGLRAKAANTLAVTLVNATASAVNADALNDCYLIVLRTA